MMHKLQWDFDIHTDHLISIRRPDLIIINNKKKEFAKLSTLVSEVTTEWEKKGKYLDLAREAKKLLEPERDDYTNYDWCFWHSN